MNLEKKIDGLITGAIFPKKTYMEFFVKKLKPYEYIQKQDGFNMSCCKISDNAELYCVRYLGTVPAYFGEKIIPGNFSSYSKKYIEKKLNGAKIKFGKNFFWNSWNEVLLDNTIFFVGQYIGDKIVINENIEPYVISNKIAFTTINKGQLKYNDVRLYSCGDTIYCYDGLITSIYQIKIINNNILIPINFDDDLYDSNKLYLKNNLCSKCNNTDCFVKQFDKNWSLIKLVDRNQIICMPPEIEMLSIKYSQHFFIFFVKI